MVSVTLLAGGVGGAKMAEGLAAVEGVELTVIGNVADDCAFHGLWVSPDIDTVTYTLADIINRKQGWGLADESTRALQMLERFGEATWMTLGDADLGLHIYRTMRRARGDRPTQIAADIARALGVGPRIILPTDDPVQTRLRTSIGELGFQEYFVRERCAPTVTGIWFEGADAARPTPEALEAIAQADLLVIAPSNPLVSIDPILAVAGLRDAMIAAATPVVAVSPLIAGKTIKGPAARMMESTGLEASALGIARHYAGLIDRLLIDSVDAGLADAVRESGIDPVVCPIVMADLAAKRSVAMQVLHAGQVDLAA
ncbi:MAG: 2-phospho-L-lactate transferase [Pseudomonadota bacterium]